MNKIQFQFSSLIRNFYNISCCLKSFEWCDKNKKLRWWGRKVEILWLRYQRREAKYSKSRSKCSNYLCWQFSSCQCVYLLLVLPLLWQCKWISVIFYVYALSIKMNWFMSKCSFSIFFYVNFCKNGNFLPLLITVITTKPRAISFSFIAMPHYYRKLFVSKNNGKKLKKYF